MQHQSTPNAQRNAKNLRLGMTDGERRLWRGLREQQLGVKFRRQHPFGNYIADFACLAPKLVVELDGSQHADQSGYDARRDTFFRAQGFEVLRFAGNAVFLNPEGVLQVILDTVQRLSAAGTHTSVTSSTTAACPHPNLPPEGEGEKH